MHWLQAQIDELVLRADVHARARRTRGDSEVDDAQARASFLAATRRVVADIASRDGVTGCFVAHEGLVADRAGDSPDFEALAAIAQTCAATASSGGVRLALGPVRQVVLVGGDNKLALLLVGQLALGIVCPVDTDLSRVLA